MNFQDAIVQLQARVPMYRTGWVPQDGYVVLMPGMGNVWKIVLTPAPNAGNYMFSVEDFLADDWMPYVLSKPAVDAVADDELNLAA